MTRLSDESDVAVWLSSLVAADPPRGAAAFSAAAALVETLGHPQRSAPAVHIVGTAGKGTVAALLTRRLVAGGVPVATHQSPHVYDLRERFLLDGRLPPWPAVLDAAEAVMTAADTVRRDRGRAPTYFAATAALSWELGRRLGAEIFVTEAGIGGRVDATAVLDRPDTVTVITRIGLDHTDVLGATVEAIAAEKAAVTAGRTRAVMGAQTPAVARVVRDIAARNGVALTEVGDPGGDWRGEAVATVDATASVVEELLMRRLPSVDAELPPGRYEVRDLGGRRVVLDGAHNPLKLAALADVVAADTRPACVVAALAVGKDLEGSASALVRLGAPVVTTEFSVAPLGGGGPRSHPAVALADAVSRAGGRAEAVPSIAAAAVRAGLIAAPGATVVVTGSFLILADIAAALGAAPPPAIS